MKFQFVFLYHSLFKLIFLRTEKYSYSNDHIDLTDKLISNLHFPFKNLFYLPFFISGFIIQSKKFVDVFKKMFQQSWTPLYKRFFGCE